MKVKEVIDKEKGKKWEVFKKSENQYYVKYCEFFKSCGWRLLFQDGGHRAGFYYSRAAIEYEFGITV